MSNPEGQAPSGWYPDPYQPGRLRYFDGTEWTDHYHYEGRLPSIGTWFGATFGVLQQHWRQVFVLAAGLGLIGNLIAWIGLRTTFDGLALADEEFVNFRTGTALLGMGVLLVSILWQGFGWLAVNRFLQRAHLQAQPSIVESLERAFQRLPKLIGAYLVLFVAGFALLVLFFALAVASAGLAIVLGIVLIVGSVWVMVKLSFLSAAIVAAPLEVSGFQASARVSTGRFWAVLGRLALLFLLIGVGSVIVDGIVGGRGSPVDQEALASIVEVDGDEVVVNDVVFEDLLPSTGDLLVYLIVGSAVGAITTAVSTSALMRLYLDSGAPSEA